ncbi:MAG: bifunctional riboflavin kinase/FAD synthetase [Planctomycetes bacterium]|nr:bifunctional riboflavin kinase/FAD synthetase [Planctomycetota bacterium]
MEIIETASDFEKIKSGCVLTIGNFDGVHKGHQLILAKAGIIANEKQTSLVAMTFEPHPVAILHPEKAPGVLTTLELKQDLLANCGVDYLVVLRDGAKMLNLSPKDFVDEFLMKNISPSVVVEGNDFNFGANRSGNIDTLKQLGEEKGFDVTVIEPQEVKLNTGQTVKVSSTMIRYMLESGHVTDAAAALGRTYRLVEKIISGRGIGKELGYPTLNMAKPTQIIPAEGVYAGFVEVEDSFEKVRKANKRVPAVFSIGQARTYGPDHPLLIEAHLLDKNIKQDLADKWMAMDFVQHIRSQHKFKSEKELADQIANDCETAKNILSIIN